MWTGKWKMLSSEVIVRSLKISFLDTVSEQSFAWSTIIVSLFLIIVFTLTEHFKCKIIDAFSFGLI